MGELLEEGELIDPITGFAYPSAWIARCQDAEGLSLVRQGLGILTSSGRVLRRGFTTGTTAAAACKAAVLSLETGVKGVNILLPCGLRVHMDATGDGGAGRCRKYAGDHPHDLTSGIEFVARASRQGDSLAFVTADGIGRYARETSRFRRGEPAISPTAQRCILGAIREACAEIGTEGISVELSAPLGREVAIQTLNPRMGIVGGISVLGSTGLVEPWDDHLLSTVLECVEQAGQPVLVTGRTGMRFARMLFPEREVILVGGKIGEALARRGENVILCGLPGLILKFIEPGILDGTGFETVEELVSSGRFSDRIQMALDRFRRRMPGVRVVLLDRVGRIVGDTG